MNNDFQVLNCEVLLQTMSYLLIFSLFYIFFNSEYTIEFCEVTYIVDPVAHTVHTQLEQLVPYTCVLCSFICVCCFAVHYTVHFCGLLIMISLFLVDKYSRSNGWSLDQNDLSMNFEDIKWKIMKQTHKEIDKQFYLLTSRSIWFSYKL